MSLYQKNITDCFFDLYGTLVDIHTDENDKKTWNRFLLTIKGYNHECNISAEELRKLYEVFCDECKIKVRRNYPDVEYPEPDFEEVFRGILQYCGITPTKEKIADAAKAFRKASTDYCTLYKNADIFLKRLKDKEIRCWLVSNAQSLYTRPELEELGLSGYFDKIYISSEVGIKKPDVRFFQKVLMENHLSPESTVMIGNDRECDILSAKACGIHTIYFHTNISPDEICSEADRSFFWADYESAYQWIIQKC